MSQPTNQNPFYKLQIKSKFLISVIGLTSLSILLTLFVNILFWSLNGLHLIGSTSIQVLFLVSSIIIFIFLFAARIISQYLVFKVWSPDNLIDLGPRLNISNAIMMAQSIGVIFMIPRSFTLLYKKISQASPCLSNKAIEFEYFSFTTFTTLGYGDIVPIETCKNLAMTEATLGVTIVPTMIGIAFAIFRNSADKKTTLKNDS